MNIFDKIVSNIHADIDNEYRWACKIGDLKLVQYLLTSPDLKEHADIHADNDAGFIWACNNGHLEVVKFLLSSPELKEHANIHANNDLGFRWACEEGYMQIVKFHIFDMNFNLSLNTKIELNSLKNKYEIFNLFENRDLQRKLQNNLKVKIQDEKPVKRTKI